MAKWTAADIPDQAGRVAVITGANTGLGYQTATALAEHGAHVILAVRNLEKGKNAAARITRRNPGGSVALQELDLTSLDSVRVAAKQLRSDYDRIDLLINNAGVMFTPEATTKDGFELQFGTNHLGHFALTGLLLDRLLGVPGSRVVSVSSTAHRTGRIRFNDLQWQQGYSTVGAYAQSKLANLLFTYELQRRLTDTETIAVAAHPGVSKTELDRNTSAWLRLITNTSGLFAQDAAMGALPTLRAATDLGVSGGQYFGPGGLGHVRGFPKAVASSSRARDAQAQKRLWAVSEDLTAVKYRVG